MPLAISSRRACSISLFRFAPVFSSFLICVFCVHIEVQAQVPSQNSPKGNLSARVHGTLEASRLAGYIVSADDHTPIAGATVEILSQKSDKAIPSVVTSSAGWFRVDDSSTVTASDYVVRISANNFSAQTIHVHIREGGGTLRFAMTKAIQ